MATADTKPLLNAEDVARLLNIKVSTVYDGVARGRLPAVRLWTGARRSLIRFRQEDIEKLLSDCTIQPSRG
jgi:excisionase family DNA binding protein